MKSATSAREILALIVLSVTEKPCRYRPVRLPFVNAPGRTMIQSVRLCLTNSSCNSCSANPVAQEKRNKDVLVVDGKHIPHVTDTERRETDETAHADFLHGADDVPRPLRSHRVFRESRRPESRHHGLLTLQGLFHRSDIHDVALNRLEIRVLDLELGGITRKRPDSVPSGESLLDQLATNATC